MRAFLLFVLLFLVGCSAKTPQMIRSPRPNSGEFSVVRQWKEYSETLHVDKLTPPEHRVMLENAVRKWRTVSAGRIRLRLEYDMDFDRLDSIVAHSLEHHTVVVEAYSGTPMANGVDERHPGKHVIGELWYLPDGSRRVTLILDRIDHYEATAMHEFGHVAGLPDLEEYGAIMSAQEVSGVEVSTDFAAGDIEVCRKHLLCP